MISYKTQQIISISTVEDYPRIWENFRDLLCDLHSDNFSFDMIGVSEVYRCENDSRLSLPGYHDLLTRCREHGTSGGDWPVCER